MKKFLNLTTALLLLLSTWSFPVSIHAEETYVDEGRKEEYILPTGGLQTPPDPIVDENADDDPTAQIQLYSTRSAYTESELFTILEKRVKDALLTGKTTIDITDLKINTSITIGYLSSYSPYISNGIDIDCYYSPTTNQYTQIEITNTMTLAQTKTYCASVDQKVNEILAQVNDTMSDEQKALVIHDYLIYEYAYDYDNYLNKTVPSDSYRSGGLFMKETGVCQAYAYAFYYLMTQLNIECYVTSSEDMNHAWNIIKINGSYYHIDCTYDDPVRDRLGKVGHTYFLCSDAVIQDENHNHNGWNLTNLKCSSTAYDNAYWTDIDSRIWFAGNTAYYIRGKSLMARGNSESELISNIDTWYVWGNPSSYWQGAYTGLFLKDNDLYYNTATEIRKYSLQDGSNSLVYKPDTSNGYIYGSRKHGNELQYVIKQSANETGTVKTVSIWPTRLTLSSSTLMMQINDTKTISYQLEPKGVNAVVTWTSSNASVAAVDNKGNVRAVSSGNAVIRATTGNGISASCSVEVVAEGVYFLRYEVMGGTNAANNPSTYTAETATFSLQNPTRSGYIFNGWYTDSAYKTKITQIAKGSVGNKTLYAKWAPASYAIVYQLNGGKNHSANPSSYTISSTVTLQNPTRSGYIFNGWYTDSAYRTRITQIPKGSSGTKTLYAKWTPITYKIRYQGNGNTAGKMADTSCTYGKASALRANAFVGKKGYSFAGWSTSASGAVVYKDKQTVQNLTTTNGAVKTLYAKWTPTKYKINYQLNGGKNNKGNPSTYTMFTATITLKNPTRSGYTFKGWYSDKACKKKVTKINKGSSGTKTLYAKWAANSYKIRYHKNGASSGKMADTSCTYGKSYTLRSNAFKKKGYSFAGWATSKNGKVVYKNKAKVKNLASSNRAVKTLYAKWKANTYKITYRLNGGKNNKKNPASYKITSAAIKLKNPTRRGYTFKGWYLDKTCKKKVTQINKGSTGNKTLYAKWVKKK